MKQQLLMEELQRQGKVPNRRLWILLGLVLVVLVAGGAYWYHATLQTRLEERFQEGLALRQSGKYAEAVELFSNLHDAYPSFARVPEALLQKAETAQIATCSGTHLWHISSSQK